MKRTSLTRMLSILLTAVLLLALFPASAFAADTGESGVIYSEITQEEFGSDDLSMDSARIQEEPEEEKYSADTSVRVSIVLEKASTLEAGYSTESVMEDASAMAYRRELEREQVSLTESISRKALDGEALDVVWNLTLAANVISAYVPYGKIDAIKKVAGVKDVVLETVYEPMVVSVDGNEPTMASAVDMTGANLVWENGYTGAGRLVAIIDTGLDTDHQSVNEAAFLHAIEEDEQLYNASYDLLDAGDIAEVLTELNIYKGYELSWGSWELYGDTGITADELYLNGKVPFAYNYIDRDFDVTHDNDAQGAHGSHVAGIAAANRYIATADGEFESARDSVFMTGAAPDAQIIVMKVFGKHGGAYDSDYMAAIEDAIVLGADAINLSLGSAAPGFSASDSEYYQNRLDSLTETDAVVAISAGNSGSWAENSVNGYPYADDVVYQTNGSPGSYTNALTVASVTNDGMVGYSFDAYDRTIVYTETNYYNPYLRTLDTSEDGSGTEYEYIFLDGIGSAAEYKAVINDNAGENIFKDKIVFVSRGEISFADKHKASYSTAKAKACVIYNNVEGAAISMQLSTSAYNACVGITKADGDFIRSQSTPVTNDAGETVYYTGTITVGSSMGAVSYHSDFYEMSSFSSWGVPGSLTLKPEITAPGGAIYSIDGSVGATDKYVVMSGTSMAAPHVTGLTALMSQYVEENALTEGRDLSARQLIQSLLMSTATPVVDADTGLPYPVIWQGAGLANAADAMNAASYVLVDGQSDGKVKAELGDDPDRSGVYSFSYTLNNLTDETLSYELDGAVYTQDSFTVDGESYLDYTLTQLDAVFSFTADGGFLSTTGGDLDGCDFNGDGEITRADGQALVDYAAGAISELYNIENADLNGDGYITAYDAELFLDLLGGCFVTLPAGDSVSVGVTVALTEAQKAELNERYPNGAYIEAYVTAVPEGNAEGVLYSGHSIPVLAFYGGWDEPNMFDRLNYTEAVAGTNGKESYLPIASSGITALNYVGLTESDGEMYFFGGNRFASDDEYLPERNAIRSDAGDGIDSLAFCLIRGAGGLRSAITDLDTGKIYAYEEFTYVYPAFYYTNGGYWNYYNQSVVPGVTEGSWMVCDLETGEPLPEGTRFELMLQAAPEYYLGEDGALDWDSIDPANTTLSLPVTVDNTEPVVSDIEAGTAVDVTTGEKLCDYIDVTVTDNEYVAAAILMTPGESRTFIRQSANQTERGEEVTVRLDVTGIFGSEFKLAVVDYAGNAVYYSVRVSEPYSGQTGRLIATTNSYGSAGFVAFDSDTNYDAELLGDTYFSIYGITYGDGYLFFNGNTSSDRTDSLYVMDYPSFDGEPVKVGAMDYNNYFVYNPDDGMIYMVYEEYDIDWDTYETTVTTTLRTIDPANAEASDVANVSYDNETMILSDIAYSVKERCFYLVGSEYGWVYDPNRGFEVMTYGDSYLFPVTVPEDGSDVTLDKENAINLGCFSTYPDLNIALDETGETSVLYILSGNNTYCDVFTYDFATGESALTGRTEYYTSLLFVGEDVPNSIARDTATSIKISASSMSVFAGGGKTLSAEVGPWCLADKTVLWTSSDGSVATVDANGRVSGVSEGTAVITATPAANPELSASCTVTVIGSNFDIKGIGTKANGESVIISGNLGTGEFTETATVRTEEGGNISVESSAMDGGKLYVQDNVLDIDSSEGCRMHIIDAETGVETARLPVNSNNVQDGSMLFGDIAYDSYQSIMFGVNGSEKLFFSTDPESNDLGSSWFNMTQDYASMTKSTSYSSYGTKYTYFYALSRDGTTLIRPRVYFDSFFGTWSAFFEYFDIENGLTASPDGNGVYQDSLVYDAVTQTPVLFRYTANGAEVYALSTDENTMTAQPILLGTIDGYESISAFSVSYVGSGADSLADEAAELPEPTGEAVQAVGASENSAPAGSLNAVPNAAVSAGTGRDAVTVTVRAEAHARSGMLDIVIGEGLTLENVAGTALLSGWSSEGNTVRFAYAGTETIEQGDVLAVLTLKRESDGESSVTVTETERGGERLNVEKTVTISEAGGSYVPAPAPEPEPEPENPTFVDVPETHWAYDSVEYMAANGAFEGVDDTHFDPEGQLTRAMLVTVLWRMQGRPDAEYTGRFGDVPDGTWYTAAVEWAAANGVVEGVADNLFAPDLAITREQIAVILWRMNGKPAASASLDGFADGDTVSDYALEAVLWAAETGLLEGDDLGRLNPTSAATRAEAAALLRRCSE